MKTLKIQVLEYREGVPDILPRTMSTYRFMNVKDTASETIGDEQVVSIYIQPDVVDK